MVSKTSPGLHSAGHAARRRLSISAVVLVVVLCGLLGALLGILYPLQAWLPQPEPAKANKAAAVVIVHERETPAALAPLEVSPDTSEAAVAPREPAKAEPTVEKTAPEALPGETAPAPPEVLPDTAETAVLSSESAKLEPISGVAPEAVPAKPIASQRQGTSRGLARPERKTGKPHARAQPSRAGHARRTRDIGAERARTQPNVLTQIPIIGPVVGLIVP